MALQDDIIYVTLLVLSIFYGKLIRIIRNGNGFGRVDKLQKYLSSAGGIVIVLLVSGHHILHPIFSVLLQIGLLRFVPSNIVHWVSFFAGFAHLFHFRLCWDFPIIPSLGCAPSHTNAIQMIMTLKMMGLAFEVHDSVLRAKKMENLQKKKDTIKDSQEGVDLESEIRFKSVITPSAEDIFHYAFCHAGILTGPYYRFRTWKDMYDYPWSRWADCGSAVLDRGYIIPAYAILFILSGHFFPINVVKEDAFYQNTNWLYRVFYMTPVFFNFRMRLYSGFVLSECSCISAGLGAYPIGSDPKPGVGPTKLSFLQESLSTWSESGDKDEGLRSYARNGIERQAMVPDFEAVHNIDEYATETVSTMRDALKTWNMTVQYWLAVNVYRRLPGLSRGLRSLVVMVVSSAWHGVYPGYYLSLGSVPFVLAVEDIYERALRRRLCESTINENNTSSTGVKMYDWVAWFARFQWFSYLGMGFQLLSIDLTLKFWHSVYYIGHLGLPIFGVLGVTVLKTALNFILPLRSRNQKEDIKRN